ncbi:MAG: CDP-diacylglycerol O-phosphatidyltransferase [Micavibrio aeruginosavorus]|uniref:CDP-diacylglycerol O-phosphatidyltransferase n=1 Tax=Micavibrio aeruginosavorus TaxID=349221 RepID=A0A2W5Q8B8_9BACT|nr:MAG: CDP-diacylglycerol O-phosphatidyltransferase [Micavibrio aeruginosavorus]
MAVSEIKPRENPTPSPSGKSGVVGLNKLIPNLMTLSAMAAGLAAIQFAWDDLWEKALLAIVVAAILDALDGATARLLKATSDFGAQLDSLSDFLAFGVAPAIILYSWILEESGKVGWIAMIVFAAASALRLARFNSTQKKLPDWKKKFFSGIPAPAGAGLALLPIMISLQFPDRFFEEYRFASPVVGLWTILIAGMMVSRIPTFSTKMIHVPAKLGMPTLAFAALLIAALFHAPWQTLSIAALFYIAAIPFAVRKFRLLQKEYNDDEDLADLAIGAISLEDLAETPDTSE